MVEYLPKRCKGLGFYPNSPGNDTDALLMPTHFLKGCFCVYVHVPENMYMRIMCAGFHRIQKGVRPPQNWSDRWLEPPDEGSGN